MPRKSRRSRRTRAAQTLPKPATPIGVRRAEQAKASPFRQAPGGRSAQSVTDVSQQYRHLRSDVRRISLVAAVCLAVLVGVYFLLR
jgi:negative regulator of sigma E activity